MTPVRLVVLLVPFLLVAGAPQSDEVLIKRGGEDRFEVFSDQELDEGDTIRTTGRPWTMDFGSAGEIWIGPRTDVVYSSGTDLTLLKGELVVQARGGIFKIRFPGGVAEAEIAAVDLEVVRGEALISRPATGGAPEETSVVIVDGDSGFTAWFEEGQSAVFAFDEETEATKVFAQEDNPVNLQVKLLDNKVDLLEGVTTLGDMLEGNRLEIPPGSEVLIRKAASVRLPREQPPEPGRSRGPTLAPWDLVFPRDEPFEDSGDILEVVNVSPSQPR